MDRLCIHCGLPIENPTPRQQAHDECKREKKNAYFREYHAKHKVPKPPKPPKPEKRCLTCGALMPPTENKGVGKRSIYCPECAKARDTQRVTQQRTDCKNARLKKCQAKPEPVKTKKRKKPIPHCWDLECKPAIRIDIEARALGLSYGKYRSLIDTLMIEPYLNEQNIYDGLERIDKAWKDFKKERKRREEVDRIARENSVMEVHT